MQPNAWFEGNKGQTHEQVITDALTLQSSQIQQYGSQYWTANKFNGEYSIFDPDTRGLRLSLVLYCSASDYLVLQKRVSCTPLAEHSRSLSVTVGHCRSLSVIVGHCRSLSVTVSHCLREDTRRYATSHLHVL